MDFTVVVMACLLLGDTNGPPKSSPNIPTGFFPGVMQEIQEGNLVTIDIQSVRFPYFSTDWFSLSFLGIGDSMVWKIL